MNIKITKEEAAPLFDLELARSVFGSRLYGTATKESDEDILIIIDDVYGLDSCGFPNIHLCQWDDLATNKQYLFATQGQLNKLVVSGDNPALIDMLLFSDIFSAETKKELFYTYRIVKGYLGYAKRDLKHFEKRRKHIQRGLYIAEKLLRKEIPSLAVMPDVINGIVGDLRFYRKAEKELRAVLMEKFHSKTIPFYSVDSFVKYKAFPVAIQKMLHANNTIEFKY